MKDGRSLDVAFYSAVATALLAPPPHIVPWPWLVGYALPALGLWAWQRRTQSLGVGAALLAGAALVAIGTALRIAVPASDATPLACVLVAPLVYFAARRASADRRYALFLALCLLVIGSVLDAPRARILAPAFAVFAAATLLLETAYAARHQRLAVRVGAPPTGARARRGTLVVGLCSLGALSLYHLLAAIPPPDRRPPVAAPTPGEGARQGLSNSFDLGRNDGWLDTVRDLTAPQLANVRCLDEATPDDLYLRFTHFDLAGANRWGTAKFLVQNQRAGDAWTLRRPPPDARSLRYEIERMPLGNGHLLLPASTWHVEGATGLEGNAEAGLLREAEPSTTPIRYVAHAAVQDLESAASDPRAMHLLALPGDLQLEDVLRLARSYLDPADVTPLQRATAIADGLRHDFQYSRQDPTGPHPDVLHNFLFHTKRGYCMHFASALAVMLRGLRIPCRIGAGLYGGKPDPTRAGWRSYGDADAHAWVELPLVDGGWVVVDATPGEVRGARARDLAADAAAAGAAQPVAADAAGASSATVPLANTALLLAGLFVLLLLGLPFVRRAPAQVVTADALPMAHPARRALAAILQQLDRHGLRRRRGETLGTLAARAAATLQFDQAALADAFAAYEELRFGAHGWDAERAARLAAGAAALREAVAKLA
jgi:hypothetical protein